MMELLRWAARSPYRYLVAAALLAAVLCLLPVQGGEPPAEVQQALESTPPDMQLAAESTAQPGAAELPVGADLSERTQQSCMLHRTLYYAPCGHSVQRREALPTRLTGLSRAALETEMDSVIPGAKITGFTAQEVDIALEAQIPCPLHWVLAAGESGRLQVMQNLTGEALEVVRETEVSTQQLTQQAQEQLLEGMVFDDVQMLEGYLENLAS